MTNSYKHKLSELIKTILLIANSQLAHKIHKKWWLKGPIWPVATIGHRQSYTILKGHL